MKVALLPALILASPLLASCADTTSSPNPAAPIGAAAANYRGTIPLVTTTAATAFTVAAIPAGFNVVNGHGGYPTMNNAGAVAGWIGQNAAVYENGRVASLPFADARAINDQGDVIGDGANGEGPVLYKAGHLYPLSNVGGTAFSINDHDVIVGNVPDPALNYASEGVYFSATASPRPMQTNPPGDTIPAFVNGNGEVAGGQEYGPPGNGYSPFLYPTPLTLCRNNATSGPASAIAGLNNKNHFILPWQNVTYLCEGSRAIILSGFPYALNDDDVVVGNAWRVPSDAATQFAYVRTSEGKYYDLNSLVPAGTPHLSGAIAVNDHDVILATEALPNTTSLRYFILTPTSRWYGL